MRVHSLEITAFGPFAETQVVDFEPLNAAGVFLLTGPTGAGKTSILDAICFGLFGQVPGVRDRAKTYRSHHGAPDLPPRVVLEVTLQGRRLRITRQPPWARPSRRARSGFVDEPARARAEELVENEWVARSTRVDEVGHLVSGMLGLNRDQFCQVVMLPQGDFQAFLGAGARERQHILETLFGTQRFQAVERWLAEHRRVQSRRCRELEEQVARLLARLQEASAAPSLGQTVDTSELAADHPALLDVVLGAVQSSAAEARSAREHSDHAGVMAKEAIHALDQAHGLGERRERHREARRRLAALDAMQEVATAREHRLRRARAAALLHPLATMTEEAAHAHAAAESDCTELLAGWVEPPGSPPAPACVQDASAAITALVGRMSELDTLASLADEGETLTQRITDDQETRAGILATVEELRDRLAGRPGPLAELRTALEETAEVARKGVNAGDRRSRALDARDAAGEVERLDAARATLESLLLTARTTANDAREEWLDARERRLAGMAAELAELLVDGQACPVCGSPDHPEPALPSAPQVSAEREAELRRRFDGSSAEVAAVETTREASRSRRAEALVRSGGLGVAAAQVAVQSAENELGQAAAATLEHGSLTLALDDMLAADQADRAAVGEATTELVRIDERFAEWSRRLEHVRTLIDTGVGGAERLPDALTSAHGQLGRARRLEAAMRSRDEIGRALRRARKRLTAALQPSEFADRSEVLTASLTAAEIATEEALVRAHDVERTTWSRVVADPTLVAAAAEPAPDLAGLQFRADDAEQAARAANALTVAVERRQSRLADLQGQLADLMTVLVPAREARDLAEQVAGLCTGSSTDNITRTALSHYVLAARLSQVVAAANQRLDAIGGGRYQLEHTMVKGAGDTRGGLGLVVRDTHTDRDRDPATLSGGETFYVSLSLALGLADVVTAEAGGAELSTLFVDEGFGTLDDDTRDEVLDELDALRSGGRSVGLVSHLSELRARCPAQLHVVATPRGSRCLSARIS